MNINQYKEIEKEIKQDYSQKYSGLRKLLYYSSFFGNIMSILLAYFFLSKLLIESVTFLHPIIIYLISLCLLCGLELFKRSLFSKFSLEFVSSAFDFGKKGVLILGISALSVIGFSFYSSLKGAKEFTSKETLLTQNLENDVKVYSDSLNVIYDVKIKDIEKETNDLKSKLSKKDDEQTQIESNEKLTKNQRDRVKDLKVEKDELKKDILLNESKITSIKKELSDNIESYKLKESENKDKEKDKNSDNSFVFVIISMIIEVLILIGIYFDKHYKWISYTDYKKKLNNDLSYQRWTIYSQILEVIYLNNPQINEKINSTKSIMENCKINNVLVTNVELINCLKLLVNLKVLKVSGSARYLIKDFDSATELLKNNFKIK